jgi:hypothetical protein
MEDYENLTALSTNALCGVKTEHSRPKLYRDV